MECAGTRAACRWRGPAEFGEVDQYQLMVENFGSVLIGQRQSIVFSLENSLGNQLVIDQILLNAKC
jgi:hypothetical protein